MLKGEFNKGVMMDARLLIVIGLIFFSNLCFSQNLEGSFRKEYMDTPVDHYFHFKNGRNFETKWRDRAKFLNVIDKGYYLLDSDSLFLFYDSIPPSIPISHFEVKSQKRLKSKSQLRMTVEVISNLSEKIPKATVAIYAGNEVLFGAVVEEDAIYSFATEDESTKTMYVSFVSYQDLKVDLAPFWGYETKIRVILEDEEQYYKHSHRCQIEKYGIMSLKRNRVELLDHNGKEVVWLRRDEKRK